MKTLKIKSIELLNFMKFGSFKTDFADFTKISGMNAEGKSTIATAVLWLLFNCDYDMHDNPAVRRTVGGKPVDDMDVSVTAAFDMDGKEVIATKTQKRKYGKDEISYKDDNSYEINSVPKTLTAFNEYFEIVPKTDKIYVIPNAFLTKKPDDMRAVLFALVDGITDLDIASGNDELSELVPLLEKYTAEELKAMNNKAYKDGKDISADRKSKIDGGMELIAQKQDLDLAEVELKKKALEDQLADCLEKQSGAEGLLVAYDKASSDALKLRFDLSDMQNKANAEIRKNKDDASKELALAGIEVGKLNHELERVATHMATMSDKADAAEAGRKDQAEKWKQAKERVFDENSLVCPYCGQELPQDRKEAMIAEFESHRAEELKSIETNGNLFKKTKEECLAEIEADRETVERLEKEIRKAEEKQAELKEKYNSLPDSVDVSQTDEYKEIEKKIAKCEETMKQFDSTAGLKEELKQQENEIRKQIVDCNSQLSAADTTDIENQIAKWKEEQKNAEQAVATAEKILYLLKQLDKCKNEKLTKEVNKHFSLVKWKLFDYAKNGEYKNCCIPTVDGKSILDISSNKGNRILGKIDICSSFQKIKGISMPIILDDAESLDSGNLKTVSEMVKSQLIALIVTDKKLKIE